MDQNKMEIEKKFSQCGDYEILETLGSGFHAKVKLGEKDGKKVAIKIFKKNHDTASNIKALTNEITILQKLNHPNLVNLIEFNNALPYRKKDGKVDQRVCIILELAQGGELFEYISSSGRFSPEVSRFYFRQLLTAMIYMSNKGICHRDLKLENILLDEVFNLKVADFGFARVMEAAKLKTNLGTPGYMAPEIIAKREYNGTKVDIFSAGVILFILYAGSPPFSTASDKDQYYRMILTNKLELFWNIHTKHKGGNPDYFPQDFRNLINGMLTPNPDQRFTLDQCMQHPWTNGSTASIEQIQNEFKKRKERVQAELLASKMKKLAQKNKTNQKQNIGEFRDSAVENEEEDFTEIIQKYKLNFENKQLTIGKNTGLANEIILYQDPKFVYCYLLKNCIDFKSSVTKIHDKKYKIHFQVNDEESEDQENENREKLQFSVEILDYQNEVIKLSVNKISGDYIKFKCIYSDIKEAINKCYQDYLQEEIQQN